MKNITTAQAIVLVACVAALVAAHKLFDSTVADGIVASVGMLINFLLGREEKPAPQPVQLSLFEGGKK